MTIKFSTDINWGRVLAMTVQGIVLLGVVCAWLMI